MEEVTTDEIDRISGLPDDILHHIFSFIQTDDVVRSSALSRRWKSLWKTIPYLNFDIYRFRCQNESDMLFNFEKMVDSVLCSQGNTKITRFRLSCADAFHEATIAIWIQVAVCRKVEEMELKLHCHHGLDNVKLPNCLFSCESLLDLKLWLPHCVLQLPNDLKLKQLRSLDIACSEISEEDLTRRLLSECTALETLTLIGCACKRIDVLDISSSSLKSLTLTMCAYISIDFGGITHHDFEDCVARISCPNVLSFTYMGGLGRNLDLRNVPFLESLRISTFPERHTDENVGSKLLDNLKHVENIKVLELHGKFMQYPFRFMDSIKVFSTTFRQLKFLKMSHIAIDGPQIQAMFLLLDHIPNLESLTLVIDEDYELNELEEDWDPNPDPDVELNAYWKNHLKSFTLINFKGILRELEFVKYMLEHGHSLEKFTVNWSKKVKKTMTKDKKMMKFRKALLIGRKKLRRQQRRIRK